MSRHAKDSFWHFSFVKYAAPLTGEKGEAGKCALAHGGACVPLIACQRMQMDHGHSQLIVPS